MADQERPFSYGTHKRGQSVPPPLTVATLRLLRLALFRSLLVENSRNPALRPAPC